MSKSLIALDTDQIKGYVFATSKLKEIRGASALLDYLNREEMPRLVGVPPSDQIYANGGGGLFLVDSDKAEDTISRVEYSYREATHTASITGISVDLPTDYGNDVEAQLELARYRLRVAKDSRNAPTLPVTHPLMHFCDSCGTGYVTTLMQSEQLCPGCSLKRQQDEQVKANIRRWADVPERLDVDSSHLWERLIANLKQQDYPVTGYGRPEDFEELGQQSVPKGYLGLIYADGDGMGRQIGQIKSLAEMRSFAQAVDGSIYQATVEAIGTHLSPSDKNTWPFDILLLGGDDLVMVTRAQSAVEVALYIVERFPELTRELWGQSLNLSASVVLAHVNYPIGSLLHLAESGLKFAKKTAAQRKMDGKILPGGLLNFLVVSSANHLDFGEYYHQVLLQEEKKDGPVQYRTQRPYTTPEMRALLEQIQNVRNVPHAKLEQLRAAVFESRQQGGIDTMMAVLRSRKEPREALLSLFGETPQQQLSMPWLQKGDDWITPVLDIVELLDFVGKEGNG